MSDYLKSLAAIYSGALFFFSLCVLFFLGFSNLNLLILLFVLALLISSLINVALFVKKQQRIPTNHEKIQLVWGSSAVAICIGSCFVFIVMMFSPYATAMIDRIDNAGLGLYSLVMLSLVIIHAALFHTLYGWYADWLNTVLNRKY